MNDRLTRRQWRRMTRGRGQLLVATILVDARHSPFAAVRVLVERRERVRDRALAASLGRAMLFALRRNLRLVARIRRGYPWLPLVDVWAEQRPEDPRKVGGQWLN